MRGSGNFKTASRADPNVSLIRAAMSRVISKRRFIGVQSAGQELERHSAAVFAQSDWIAQASEGVVIGDEVERFGFVLQCDRRPHHAKVIADMQNAARLNARKNAHRFFHRPNTLRDAKNPRNCSKKFGPRNMPNTLKCQTFRAYFFFSVISCEGTQTFSLCAQRSCTPLTV